MNSLSHNMLELPLEKRALLALKAAVRKVIEEHARIGLPLHICSGGKVITVSAKQLQTRLRRSPSAKSNHARKAR